MKKLDQNLSEIFDVTPLTEQQLPVEQTDIVSDIVDEKETTDVDVDYNLARDNIKSLIRKGDTAIDEIIKVATASEHPRAFEVAATFIKTMADLNKDLLEIQKKRKDLSVESLTKNSQTTNIDKAVFVGSTAELIKMIKNN